jgi:beta-galactosidase/beta-glucuronidase
MTVPRPEYPRPQLVRDRWLTLNGIWQFEIDRGDSGLQRGLLDRDLEHEILVPFAPESTASGVEDTDYLHAVWYRRTVTIPADWTGSDVLLHLGAVDHDATVWANGIEVARHRGGFTPFTADLSAVASAGEDVTIVVRARDEARGPQARGKQSVAYANADCHYTRTTGIWQTVWLEPVPSQRIERVRITPRFTDGAFDVEASVRRRAGGLRIAVEIRDADGVVATGEIGADDEMTPSVRLTLPEDRRRAWSTTDPHLYDITVRLLDADGEPLDAVDSYAGLRSVSVRGQQILINGERVFQRLVLDQGYWPDTLMTAPSDEALRADIELGIAAGFNGARLHQKVFEERYLYHADKLGYLVWGEFGDWGAAVPGTIEDHQHPTTTFVTQWLEALQRDINHPSIIGWCPLNETWEAIADRITQLDDVTHAMYLATKLADPTRPVLDTSGYSHRVRGADVYDSHLYEQDPARFAELMAGLDAGEPYVNEHGGRTISLPYAGQPYFCSEYGGIWWNEAKADAAGNNRSESWGYGERVRDLDEWYTRFAGLTDALLDDPRMFGYCYTQLTDTFQEENGIYDFERRPKFDLDRVRAIQTRAAAYEISGPPAD